MNAVMNAVNALSILYRTIAQKIRFWRVKKAYRDPINMSDSCEDAVKKACVAKGISLRNVSYDAFWIDNPKKTFRTDCEPCTGTCCIRVLFRSKRKNRHDAESIKDFLMESPHRGRLRHARITTRTTDDFSFESILTFKTYFYANWVAYNPLDNTP